MVSLCLVVNVVFVVRAGHIFVNVSSNLAVMSLVAVHGCMFNIQSY